MSRGRRVDDSGVNRESAAQREIADRQKASGTNSPKVEDVADGGRENDQFGSEPYRPEASIDSTHPVDGS